MEIFRKLSIAQKILLIPIVGALGFITYLVFSVAAINDAVHKLDLARNQQFPLLQIAESNKVRVEKIKELLSAAVSSNEKDMLGQADLLADKLRSDLRTVTTDRNETKRKVDEILAGFENYFKAARGLSAGMIEGNIDFSTVGQKSDEMTNLLKLLEQKISNFYEQQMKEFSDAFDNAHNEASNIASFGFILAFITIALLFGTAYPVSRSIKSNLRDVISTLKNMGEDNGDLTVRLKTRSKDEVGDLVYWFNSFLDKLQQVIKQIVDSALPLAELSTVVNNLSSEMKTTLAAQRESANQSKLSVDEMSLSVASIAQNAAEAAGSAKSADSLAENGKGVVQTTVSSIQQLSLNMNETATVVSQLESDTNKVNVVLDVIKGIAEQTNLLALNAAIEAARAGDQGRGFAVVADEVRGLASRTQESTEEINTIIAQLQEASRAATQNMSSCTESLEHSVENANKAGESLDSITETVNTINSMNDQIAVATEEQEHVSRLMVGHVEEIQQQTEQTSNSSVQLTDVAEQLDQLAQGLEKITRQFKL